MLKINVKNEFQIAGIIPCVHGIAWSMSSMEMVTA